MNSIKRIVLSLFVVLSFSVQAAPTSTDSQNVIRESTPTQDIDLLTNKNVTKAIKNLERIHTDVKLAVALQALAMIPENFYYSGKGGVDYWLRSAEDFARTARALGKGLSVLTAKMEKGPVETALSTTATQLTNVVSGERGDVNYWMNRTQAIAEEIRSATDQIIRISNKMGDQTTHVSTAIISLSIVITSSSSQGYGDQYYWARAASIIAKLAHGCGNSLEYLAGALPDPLYTVLSTYSHQLVQVNGKGEGDASYWRDRTKAISKQTDNIGLALLEISKQV